MLFLNLCCIFLVWSVYCITIFVLQINGHKRVESLNNYTDMMEEEEVALGAVLGRPQPTTYHSALNDPATRHSTSTSTGTIGQEDTYEPSKLGARFPHTVFQNCTITNLNIPWTLWSALLYLMIFNTLLITWPVYPDCLLMIELTTLMLTLGEVQNLWAHAFK